MKKLMYSAAILLSLALQVTAQTSNLVIFDQQGESFYAIVNGVRQNNTPQTNVRITGLAAPAAYKITILFKDTTIPAVNKNIYIQNVATEITANVVTKKDGEHVLRYVSATPIAQALPPPSDQSTISYTTTQVAPAPVTTTTVTQQTTTNPAGGSVSMNVGGLGTGMNVNVSGMNTQTTVTTTTTSTSTNSGGEMNSAPAPQPVYVSGYNGPIGCPMPMSEADYEGAKNTISSKTFESDKLTIAKQIASSNCLTAHQVKGIMLLFTFEDSKLEFAKFAYGHTYDKGNYYKVNDAFQFSSSTDALNQYISSQH